MHGVVVQIEGSPLRAVYGEVPAASGIGTVQLSSIPEPSGASFDPDTGNSTSSRMAVSISATGAGRLVFLRTASRPLVALASAVSDSAGVLTVASAVTIPSGTYLWVGDEVMQVINATGTTITVSRGLGAPAQAHDAGTFIWLGSPYWRRRRATMTVYADGAPVGVWAGLVDGAPKGSSDGTKITLDLCGIWTLARDIMSNRDSRASFTENGLLSIGVAFSPASSPVRANPLPGQQRVFQLGAGMFTTNAPGGGTVSQGLLDTPAIAELGLTDAQLKRTPIFELFTAGKAFILPHRTMCGATRPHHPIEIALTLMGVHPEVQLSRPWVPGIAQFWSNAAVNAARGLAFQTADLEIDHLVLGWDGKPFAVLEVVRDLLRLWGFYLVEGADGLLSIVQYRVGDALGDYPLLPLVRDTLGWEGASGGAADRVVAEVGALPFRAGASVEVGLRQGQLDAWDVVGETLTLNAATVSLARADEVFVGQVLEAAYRRQRGQPTMQLRLRTGQGGPPAMGALYRLGTPQGLLTPLFPKVDGTLTASLQGDTAFTAWIVGVRWLVRLGTYEITAQLNNWAVNGLLKTRAPSGEVLTAVELGFEGAHDITLSARYWGELGDQTGNWTIGQQVSFWTADGEPTGVTGEIVVITPPNLLVVYNLSATPAPGHLIRLTPSTTQSPDAWNLLDNGDFYA